MECNQIPPVELWGEDQAKREVYRRHLRSCLACKRRVFAGAPDELLFDFKEEPLAEEFWTGFWDSLEKKLPDRQTDRPSRRNPYRFARWAAVFAAALLIALFSRNLPRDAPQQKVTRQSLKREELPLIEDVKNPNAKYYIIQSGEKENIIMVYDPDMEL